MAVNVVAAVIKRNDKVFATQRGYGELRAVGNFLVEKLSLVKELKRH